jgi:hypothetical protein
MARSSAVKWGLQSTPTLENFETLEKLFASPGWELSFGGPKWESICRIGKQYAPSVVWLDTIINAVHNGTFVLNKTEALQYVFTFNSDAFRGGYQPIGYLTKNLLQFLTYRAKAKDILQGEAEWMYPSGKVGGYANVVVRANIFSTNVRNASYEYRSKEWGGKKLKLVTKRGMSIQQFKCAQQLFKWTLELPDKYVFISFGPKLWDAPFEGEPIFHAVVNNSFNNSFGVVARLSNEQYGAIEDRLVWCNSCSGYHVAGLPDGTTLAGVNQLLTEAGHEPIIE